MRHFRHRRLVAFTLMVAAALTFPLTAFAAEVVPAPASGAQVRVVAKGLPMVDRLARAADGTLYATLELGNGRGRVVRITPDGTISVILQALDRPDGLLLVDDTLYITEEIRAGRLLAYHLASGVLRQLAILRMPEGIDRLADGRLVIAEDRAPGRVVTVTDDGTIGLLVGGLNRPEGLAVADDGQGHEIIWVCETATGRLLALRDGKISVAAAGMREPDQVAVAPGGAVFVTEDATPGRLLKLGPGGTMLPVLEGLSAPQGMAFRPANGNCGAAIYVAEQGKGRILQVGPVCGAAD
ncbi:MAG: hypothetical protein OEW11_06835 [Nitrospirota bacterium]|nr:hypothetical protein [Nitrospirota bacterium]